MNAAHFHLVINHFPVIGTVIAIFVLIIGILKKSDDVKKVSVLILVLTALVTIPVYLSGEDAQAKIEGNYEDVDEEYIDAHEDFALYSFIAMDIVGALALVSVFLHKKPKTLPNSFAYFFLALLLIVNGMMAYTANLGGKIHHPEIREDTMPWESPAAGNEKDKGQINDKNEEHEDEDHENEEHEK